MTAAVLKVKRPNTTNLAIVNFRALNFVAQHMSYIPPEFCGRMCTARRAVNLRALPSPRLNTADMLGTTDAALQQLGSFCKSSKWHDFGHTNY